MEPKKISPVTIAIQKRFFEALEVLCDTGKISGAPKVLTPGFKKGGLNTFCVEYGFNQAKYSNIRVDLRDPSLHSDQSNRHRLIDFDAIYILVKDFGVSANWIITGRGEMFTYKTQSPSLSHHPQ